MLKSQHSLKIDIGCFILIEANLSSGSFTDTPEVGAAQKPKTAFGRLESK
jgi:hypothetical protein